MSPTFQPVPVVTQHLWVPQHAVSLLLLFLGVEFVDSVGSAPLASLSSSEAIYHVDRPQCEGCSEYRRLRLGQMCWSLEEAERVPALERLQIGSPMEDPRNKCKLL